MFIFFLSNWNKPFLSLLFTLGTKIAAPDCVNEWWDNGYDGSSHRDDTARLYGEELGGHMLAAASNS